MLKKKKTILIFVACVKTKNISNKTVASLYLFCFMSYKCWSSVDWFLFFFFFWRGMGARPHFSYSFVVVVFIKMTSISFQNCNLTLLIHGYIN